MAVKGWRGRGGARGAPLSWQGHCCHGGGTAVRGESSRQMLAHTAADQEAEDEVSPVYKLQGLPPKDVLPTRPHLPKVASLPETAPQLGTKHLSP